MELRKSSRWLLTIAGILLLAGGSFHTWAYSKAAAMIDASNLPARNAPLFKGLWLVDSGEVILIGLAFLALAWRPRLGNRALLGFLAALLIASAVAVYATVGNFVPAHLLVTSALMGIAAALLPARQA
jgi:uncharacterized membrane protein YecN with MAPEG domain